MQRSPLRLIAALALTALAACTPNTVTSVTIDGGDRTTTLGDPLTPGTAGITATSTSDPTKSDTITLTTHPQGALRWTRQLGTSSDDYARGIATDTNGNVATAGYTQGALTSTNAGGVDTFIRSYTR